MTDQIVTSASLSVASVTAPPDGRLNSAMVSVASEFLQNPGGVLLQMGRISVASPFVSAPLNDCWVWDGSQEVPASVFVWDGSQEVPSSLEVV